MASAAPTTLASPALYLGEVSVVPPARRRRRGLLRAGPLKEALAVHLHWAVRHLPAQVTRAWVRVLCETARATHVLPGHPLVATCRDVALLAARRGHRHLPAALAGGFVDRLRRVFEHAIRLWHEGPEAVRGAVHVPAGTRALFQRMREQHGAGFLAVPHNQGAVLASIEVSRLAPTVLVSRNPASVARTRAALDLYERMGVRVLMVRGANPYEVARACLGALRDGQVLVVTVDNLVRNAAVPVRMFGREVSLPSWAARIAARARLPILPAWIGFERGRFCVEAPGVLVADDPAEAVRRCAAWFEERILADPASWGFLADKRWRKVLAAAARDASEADGTGRRV
jgi:lauroyl/myristoyl acyltransferase